MNSHHTIANQRIPSQLKMVMDEAMIRDLIQHAGNEGSTRISKAFYIALRRLEQAEAEFIEANDSTAKYVDTSIESQISQVKHEIMVKNGLIFDAGTLSMEALNHAQCLGYEADEMSMMILQSEREIILAKKVIGDARLQCSKLSEELSILQKQIEILSNKRDRCEDREYSCIKKSRTLQQQLEHLNQDFEELQLLLAKSVSEESRALSEIELLRLQLDEAVERNRSLTSHASQFYVETIASLSLARTHVSKHLTSSIESTTLQLEANGESLICKCKQTIGEAIFIASQIISTTMDITRRLIGDGVELFEWSFNRSIQANYKSWSMMFQAEA